MNLDVRGFNVFSTGNINNLVVLDVSEVGAIILEDLPPLRVSAPKMHVGRSS
jgi:hypothetical protein